MHPISRSLAKLAAVISILATPGLAQPLRLFTLSGGSNGAPLEWRDYYDAPFSPVRPRSIVADSTGGVVFCNDLDRFVTRISASGVVTYAPNQGLVLDLVRSIAIGPRDVLAIADVNRVGLISPDGTYSVLAGSYNESGSNDGSGSTARFMSPRGLAFGPGGTVYVTDTDNHTVRRVAADGSVLTLAGTAGTFGNVDATGFAARFNAPRGIAVDAAGNVFVADTHNSTIRKLTPAGVVTTIAGSAGQAGFANGSGAAARFNLPEGIAVDINSDLIVADTENGRIRRVTQAGVVTTIAGGPSFSNENVGINAFLIRPTGVAVDTSGRIYITDNEGFRIHRGVRALTGPTGLPSTVAAVETYSTRIDTTITDEAGSFTHRWQISTNAGSTWSDLANVGPYAGVTTAILSLAPATRDLHQHEYRVIIGDGVSERSSDPCTLLVEAPLIVTTVAGTVRTGTVDATGTDARFTSPAGAAIDSLGNLFVCDLRANVIRKISPTGVVTTFAGLAGSFGSTDGAGATARFRIPQALAIDSNDVLFVVDSGNHTVRRVSPAGVVTTLAGAAGQAGTVDGEGTTARFRAPAGIAIDHAGNLFVSDAFSIIRKITPAGVVSTLAGTADQTGTADGTGAAARFSSPRGLVADAADNLFVCDSTGSIRRITPGGVVTTFAGNGAEIGSDDGFGSAARFWFPTEIAIDASGTFYVSDGLNHNLRKMLPDGTVTTLAGLALNSGYVDGAPATARFNNPRGVAVNALGELLVVDESNGSVRKISPAGVVSTVAGAGPYNVDASGPAARFGSPAGIEVDAAGNVYIADFFNHTIRKVTPNGAVTTIAGAPGIAGHADGPGGIARFNGPTDIALASNGDLVIADSRSATIRRMTPQGAVTTIAGIPGKGGAIDGPLAQATLRPFSVALNSAGDIFVGEDLGGRIRKVSLSSGQVSTFGSLASFSPIRGVAVDRHGNIYASEYALGTIHKFTPDGTKSLLAGAGSGGNNDGTGAAASFSLPTALAIDAVGDLFVADSFNQLIRRITPEGVVTTMAGLRNQPAALVEGTGSAARLITPNGLAFSPAGILYISSSAGVVSKGVREIALLAQPAGAARYSGQSATFNVAATGTGPVTIRWQVQGAGEASFTDVPGAVGETLSIPSVQRFHAGSYRAIATANGLSAISKTVDLAVSPAPGSSARLLNISTRGLAQSGDNVLIPGFVVSGTANKKLLIRAVGPTLAVAPIEFSGAVIPDPQMTLKRFNFGTKVYEDYEANDDWQTNANAAAIATTAAQLYAFELKNSREAALLVDLPPGQYSVIAGDKNGASGIAIVELYDADSANPASRLINISNRGFAGNGDQVMIPGFVVSEEGPMTLLVRVVGPTLGAAPYNVTGTMADPKLTVYRTNPATGQSTELLAQDNWSENPDAATTAQIATQVFAFPLAAGSKDAAFVVTLQSGVYTMIGSSAVTGGTGVVLVEVYVVP